MKTTDFNLQQNLLRSLAIIPAAMLPATFLVRHHNLRILIGLVVSYFIAFICSHVLKIKSRVLYTIVVIFLCDYYFALNKTIISLMHEGKSILYNLDKVFLASGVLSAVTFGIMIPAWIIFILIDLGICKAIINREVEKK